MTIKLFFLFMGKIFASIEAILLSILCFPKINILFFSLPAKLSVGCWLALICLSILLSVIVCFIWKSKISIVERISLILLNPLLFAVSCIEGVFLQYDAESANLIFYLIGIFAMAGSISLSIFWLYHAKLVYKKEKA